MIELGQNLKIETKKEEWKRPLDLIEEAFVSETQYSHHLFDLVEKAK